MERLDPVDAENDQERWIILKIGDVGIKVVRGGQNIPSAPYQSRRDVKGRQQTYFLWDHGPITGVALITELSGNCGWYIQVEQWKELRSVLIDPLR